MGSDKVALVTGSGRGIGRGIALALAPLGYTVVVNATTTERGAETVKAVEAAGGMAWSQGADISKTTDRNALVDAILQREGRIDLLVNNAGVAPNVRADILEAGEESYDRVMDINLKGPYFLTQRVANEMLALQGDGPAGYEPRIVNISSISVYAASPSRGEYCLSKAGIGMMTKLYAARLAEAGIGVYEVCPGIIETDMTSAVKEKYDRLIDEGLTPIRRWGTPEDIGKAVATVARGELPFSTGEVINVDGGFHLHVL